MMKKFLDKYNTVIFDMDGVITSEENYWNSAALTVWEYLSWNSGRGIDTERCMSNVKEIRKKVFCGDALISILKNKGVNSNWDLGYVTVLLTWIVNGRDNWDDFGKVLEYAKGLPDNIIDAYDDIAMKCHNATGFDYDRLKRNDLMWQTMHGLFQEWFLGDELNGKPSIHGRKTGLLNNEEPIIDKTALITMLKLLSENKRVCTGTGRPYIEMLKPLQQWGVLKYFAADGLSNYDHVAAAEAKTGQNLTKPHPYMFLKALYGTDCDDAKLLNGEYDRSEITKTLIVGDAGADILAAKAMGADFCAVLTGINGKAAHSFFKELGAEYILDSAAELI